MSRRTEYSVVVTEPAQDDLEAIAHFTALHWGEKQAIAYRGMLSTAFLKLRAQPEQGRCYDGLQKPYQHWKVGRHVIFYRVEHTTIYIVRVLHDSMDFSQHLE